MVIYYEVYISEALQASLPPEKYQGFQTVGVERQEK
jgi:hypothetical protein